MIRQHPFALTPRPRGFHVITREVISAIGDLPYQGLLHLYIKHTSAGLTINEAADPDVLVDFESFFNKIVPENEPFLVHTMEGPDDMPAHIKASIVGSSVTIPITNAQLNMGTWQGIYLCEFRNRGGSRQLVASRHDIRLVTSDRTNSRRITSRTMAIYTCRATSCNHRSKYFDERYRTWVPDGGWNLVQ